MNEQQVLEELIEIFKSSVDDPSRDYSKITLDTGLYDELGISSISAIYMALEIESRFGLALTNEDTVSLKTVGDLVKMIMEKGE